VEISPREKICDQKFAAILETRSTFDVLELGDELPENVNHGWTRIHTDKKKIETDSRVHETLSIFR
jgi:hypothetical protein